MTNLDSILKSRDITLLTKVGLVKAIVFPVVMCGCESWTIKKADHQRIDAFELWCWRTLLRVPWTARKSNQLILKEINPGYSLEGLMLKLKLQYFGHLMWRTDSLEKIEYRRKDWRKDWRQEERLKAGGEWQEENEIVGWHHWLDGHEFEQAPGVGQGSLACCSPWGCRVGQLSNWTELNISYRAGLMVINSSEFVYLKQCLFLFHFWSYFSCIWYSRLTVFFFQCFKCHSSVIWLT